MIEKIFNRKFTPNLTKGDNKKLNKKSTNKKGEYTMKKIISILVTVTILTIALTGCGNPFRVDKNHAKVSYSTTSGQAGNGRSFNGAGMSVSGQELALRNRSTLVLKKGDKLHLSFECEACGDVQEFDIDEAWAKTISCKCPEQIDEKGNAKEYVAISVGFED